MDQRKDHELPPPPPMLEGTRPTIAPGYSNVVATSCTIVPKIATRPRYGKTGQLIELIVNHFNARLVKDDDIYQYHVLIEPEVRNKKIFRDVMTKVQETFGAVEFRGRSFAFDGEKTLFTYGQLSFNFKEFPVFLDNNNGGGGHQRSADDDRSVPKKKKANPRGRDYIVKITLATKVQMKSLKDMMQGRGDARESHDALRVLDTVLHESAARQNFLLVKDNFFHSSLGSVLELGEGIVGWRGYHSSVRPTGMGLTLNLDITMTTVLSPISIVEFLQERFNLRDVSDMRKRDWPKAKSILKNVRVQTKHMAIMRTHKIAGFSDRPIQELKFTRRIIEGQHNVREEETSVAQYYYDTYNYKLKYPNLPALDVGNKKKSTFLPIELCTIVEGQRYMGSLSSKQRQLQIAACKQGPEERQQLCEKAINVNKYNSDKLLAEFGLEFDNSLTRVEGRVLRAPQLEFGDKRVERPQDGRWNFNNKKLNQGADIGPWALVVFDPRYNDGGFIRDQLMASCCKRGMRIGRPLCVVKEAHDALHYSPEERVLKLFNEVKLRSSREPEFVLAVLPEKDSSLYVPIKRLCEIQIGVISQCMVKPRNMNDQYFGNLALKINLKFGGYNSLLAQGMTTCLDPSTIIFGMDVSHGSPGDVNVPSIAAVVATKNWPSDFHYSTQVRSQPSKMEMIQDLQSMVRECLVAYYYSCPSFWNEEKRKPSQIIVYRDGLGESQFLECLEVEFMAFKKACKQLEENYNPTITFIVCQKRHNTRFFPRGRERLKNGNVLPGTVVDKGVCHPYGYNFFLVSQAGLIGTSRPTHYHVLVDENKLGPDAIQELTYNLCHTFGRCTTSISMAAPAAYAHVLALRYMKTFVNTSERGSDTASLRSSRDGQVADPRPIQELLKLRSNIIQPKHSMFFV